MVPPLADDREVRQVLRYWLGALRFEESVASRPRAHRPDPRALDSASTQPYFRIGVEPAAFWTSARGDVGATMDPALQRFYRHWVRRTSRRPAAGRSSEVDSDPSRDAWIAGWPAVFFERRDEIATLFRFPVQLEWRFGDALWERFDPATRRPVRREPDAVVVRAAEGDEGDAPTLSIDRHLLHATLGLLEDEIALIEARWRDDSDPAAIVTQVLQWLAPELAGARSPGEIFRNVVEAVSRRLPHGVSVYPTGIIQDGSLVFATHHLQRELVELASLRAGEPPLRPGTALWSYLTGAPSDPERAPLRGRFRARGLTASQRAAAELAVGSRLAAVQGPPGTGKTELIQSLAAHALVERIDGWTRGGAMSSGLLVVASTNNRAVDNAIDPIGSQIEDDRLPIALRSGNQEVTRTITAQELARALNWLARQNDADAFERLDEARTTFRQASEQLSAITASHVARLRRDSRLRAICRELAALPPDPDREEGDLHDRLVALRAAIGTMRHGAGSRRTKVERLAQRWARIAADLLAPLLRLRPDLAAVLPLPPAAGGRAAWRDALDDALDELVDALAEVQRRRRAVLQRAELTRELAKLEAAPLAPPVDAATEREIEVQAHALFRSALEVRERWAIANRSALTATLGKAADAALKVRTLRHLLEGDASGSPGLRALYPVVGCTLLSLGNVFRHASGEIDALVIDEAGQCHPAYPVSGLARARRTLFIGDVQQLSPVVTVSPRDEARIRRAARVDLDDERLAPFAIHDRAGTSAQALADRAVLERPTLIDHFRCQRAIIALSDELCGYRLTVHTPARTLSERVARLVAPVLFDAVRGEQVRARGSWANEAEAERLVELLLEMRAAGLSLSDVGVLTPYVGQLELLRQLLRRRGMPLEAARDETDTMLPALAADALSIGTVHRFQGGERSVILLSTAITRDRDLAFIDERANLLNVAISRARDHLVTFGCEEVLRGGRHTRLLVERAARLP